MTDTRKQDEAALVHWTYSRDEWRNFMRWKKRKKGFFHYMLHRLFSKSDTRTPEIKITQDKVSVDNNHEPFHDESCRLKRVNISDAGRMNVMEIGYERSHNAGVISREIYVPVPKGKLREAIEVQDRLHTKT